MPSLVSKITRIWRDLDGASAMLVAIALPVLIGFGALGAEAGVWFTFKLRNQSAADSAAIAAAYEVIAGRTDIAADLTPAANEAAARNGYAGSTPAVIYPYADTIVSNGIAVTLEQSLQALLASMFLTHVTVATRAVAVIQALDHACILALGTGGTGVEIGDGATIDMPGCSVAANSRSANAIAVDDNTSSITAATLVAAGEISLQGSPINPDAPPAELILATRPIIGAPDIADPYTRILTHAFLAAGMPGTASLHHSWRNVTETIYPGLYGEGMSFESSAVIDLVPGVYYVTNGDFSVALGATVTCKTCGGANGVTIILTTTSGPVGSVQISSGASVTLQAPNAGTFSGILFVQDPMAVPGGSTTPDNRFEAGGSMKLTGLLYFPKTTLAFEGNPGAACTLTVADQVVIYGASGFSATGCTSAGLAVLPTVVTAALAK